MEWRIAGTRIRVHPLMMLLPLLAAMLGKAEETVAVMLSLALHESAHLLCARILGARVEELRLMPFGGSAQLGNLYLLSGIRLFAISATGPAANLALVVLSAALAQWQLLSPLKALTLMRCSLTLMLFNLLPALPLDGGRMLYALIARRLGRKRAVEIGILSGRILCALLLMGALAGSIGSHRLNISPILAAVFIVASAENEKKALTEARVSSLLSALKRADDPIPMQICAVSSDCSLKDALKCVVPDSATLFAIYDHGEMEGFLDDKTVLEVALKDPMQAMRAIMPRCAYICSNKRPAAG